MPSQPDEAVVRNIKRLIWAYFWLLLIEGALRKWVVPQLSDPLLIIRDPVVIAIYLLAIKARVFPRNRFIFALAIISGLTWVVGMLVLEPYLSLRPLLLVTVYGLRCNFLHLPLIWVLGRVLDAEDVKRIGWWILLLLMPLAVLMTIQFRAEPDAFINRGAGTGDVMQITAGSGKIRPPATFSFISGMIFYAAAAAAFLIYGGLTRTTYRNWILYASGFALVVAIGVSGSRSVLLSVIVVVASLGLILLMQPKALNKFGRSLLIAVTMLLLASRLPIFKEGVDVLTERFTASAEAAETSVAGGLISRTLSDFTEGLKVLNRMPTWGYGLGVGTNAGAKMLTGSATFLLSEGEWSRLLLESGPIIGLSFIIWRVALAGWLGVVCVRKLKGGEILPIILYSTCFLPLMNGQFGQPTNLGFAVFLGGLALATANSERFRTASTKLPADKTVASGPPPPIVRRRSPYAERMHQRTAPRENPNGSADR